MVLERILLEKESSGLVESQEFLRCEIRFLANNLVPCTLIQVKSTCIKMFVLNVGVWNCSPGMLLGKLVHDFVHIFDFAVKSLV